MATATFDAQFTTQVAKGFAELLDPFRRENIFLGISRTTGTGQTTRTLSNDIQTRKRMLFAKLLTSSDVSLLIERKDWQEGTVYDQFDPSADMSSKNFYVYNPLSKSVYVCVENGGGNESINIPNTTSPDEEIFSDGYKWRFMYSITSDQEKFVDSSFLPIRSLPYYSDLINAYSDLRQNQYYSQYIAESDPNKGQIQSVGLTYGASDTKAVYGKSLGYDLSRKLLAASSTEAFLDGGDLSTDDDAYNGYGIAFLSGLQNGTVHTITDYSGSQKKVTYPAIIGTAPSAGDLYKIVPMVSFIGDGTGATAFADVDANNAPETVVVTNRGSNFTTATAQISTTKDSGTNPTLSPVVFPVIGRDPVFELFTKSAKIIANIEGDENGLAMIGNDYKEFFLMSGPSVGLSYDNTGTLAGNDSFRITQVDVKSVSETNIPTSLVTSGDFIYGKTTKNFAEVQTSSIDLQEAAINAKNIDRDFDKDETIQILKTSGSTLETQNNVLKVVRTRLDDTTLSVPKVDWRCTYSVGISTDGTNFPLNDTSVTGASGSIGIVTQFIEHGDYADGSGGGTVFLTNVIKGSGSATLDFDINERITTTNGNVTVKDILGPELDLDSGKMLYIDGITAVTRTEAQDDLIEIRIDF